MLLRGPQVAGVLEGDPRVAGLEQRGQHLAPQLDGAHPAVHPQLAPVRRGLVLGVAGRERLTHQIVQVGHLVRGEQRPLTVGLHPSQELVRNPVGSVHVVGAPPVVTGVLPQVEEFLDIHVPGFQVGADRPLALAALIDGHRGVVGDLQERHHAGGQPVGALDVCADPADRRPVVAEAAGVLRQQRVVLDGLEDGVQIVVHRRQEARGQLRPGGSGVEQGRRRRHEIEAGQQPVELDRPALPVDFPDRQPHRHPHEKGLRQFVSDSLVVQEIAVVERLQTEKRERAVPLAVQRVTDDVQVELAQHGIELTEFDAAGHEPPEVLGVPLGHLLRGRLVRRPGKEAQRLPPQRVGEQSRGDPGVVGLGFHQRPGGHDGRQTRTPARTSCRTGCPWSPASTAAASTPANPAQASATTACKRAVSSGAGLPSLPMTVKLPAASGIPVATVAESARSALARRCSSRYRMYALATAAWPPRISASSTWSWISSRSIGRPGA